MNIHPACGRLRFASIVGGMLSVAPPMLIGGPRPAEAAQVRLR